MVLCVIKMSQPPRLTSVFACTSPSQNPPQGGACSVMGCRGGLHLPRCCQSLESGSPSCPVDVFRTITSQQLQERIELYKLYTSSLQREDALRNKKSGDSLGFTSSRAAISKWNDDERDYRVRMKSLNKDQQEVFNLKHAVHGIQNPSDSRILINNRFQVLRSTNAPGLSHHSSPTHEEFEHKYDDEEKVVKKDSKLLETRFVARHWRLIKPQCIELVVGRRSLKWVGAPRSLQDPALRRVVLLPIASQAPACVVELARRVANVAHQSPTPDEDPEEEPVLRQRDPKVEGPGNDIIGFRDQRMLDTRFRMYYYPDLDFIGKWNSARSGDELIIRHLGFHFNERTLQVRLPWSIVDEMKDFWTGKIRDKDTYKLSEAFCKVRVAALAIKADEQWVANMYAPSIGFRESHNVQQNVARVTWGDHFDLTSYTLPRLVSSWNTYFGMFSMIGVSVFSLVSFVWMCHYRSRLAAMTLRLNDSIGCPPWIRSLAVAIQRAIEFRIYSFIRIYSVRRFPEG